ncbi:MAG: hypothetical protein ACI8SE_000638 [Bacteroidia bacterium]|jgi:hypothetical protein
MHPISIKVSMRITAITLFILLGQSALADTTNSAPQYRWRISNMNGYPIYSDIDYTQATLFGHKTWQMDERLIQTGITLFAVPQLSISFIDPKSAWHYALETRVSPYTNLFATSGSYPKPYERADYALNVLIGKSIRHRSWNNRIFVGFSTRYVATFLMNSPDQDVFYGKPDSNHLEPGFAIKYEITKILGEKEHWELGLGINQIWYPSKIHVLNLGLVLGYRFGKPAGSNPN